MPPAERSARRLLAQGVLWALLLLAAIVAYLTLAPPWRPTGIRLAGTLLVIAGCVRLRGAVRRSIGYPAASALDATAPEPPGPELDQRFLRARDDVLASARSGRYFDAVLWPRLLALAGGELARPELRRRRRGPSLRAIEGLIAEAERRA